MVRYSKHFAFISFFYQAASGILLFISLAAILSPSQYSDFSVLYATGQFFSIAFFEWIRLALSRFYPGSTAADEEKQNSSIYTEFFGCSIACAAFYFSWQLLAGGLDGTAILLAVIAGQGASDLILSALRFRGKLLGFAIVQMARSTLTLFFATASSLYFSSIPHVLTALSIAHICTILFAIYFLPDMRLKTSLSLHKDVLKSHVLYGVPAAGASALGVGALLVLRYAIQGSAPSSLSPGILFAFDMMQRPFNIIIAALHAILYPSVVASFDAGDGVKTYRRLINVELLSVISIALIALFTVRFGAEILLNNELSNGFLYAAVPSILMFSIRSVQTNISHLLLHLHKKTGIILILGSLDFAAYSSLYALCYYQYIEIYTALYICVVVAIVQSSAAFYITRNYSLTGK